MTVRWCARCALAVAGAVVAFCIVETALRFTAPLDRFRTALTPPWNWVVYDPIVVRSNLPGFESTEPPVSIGSLGFRGPDPIIPKPQGTVRIACLGDSTTFGLFREGPFSFSTQTSYPAELGRLASERGLSHVDVVNAGVLGYTSAEGLVMLVTRVLPLQPDVITLRFGNNDHARAWPRESAVAMDAEYAALRALPQSLWRLELVRLAFFTYRQYGPMRDAGFAKIPLDRFELNLRRLVTTARSHGIHVLLLDFPYRRSPGPGDRWPDMSGARSLDELLALHGKYQEVVERVARNTDTPVVRTAEAFAQLPDPPFTEWDVSHPNALGYRTIAERLLDATLDRGWLTRTAPGGGPALPADG